MGRKRHDYVVVKPGPSREPYTKAKAKRVAKHGGGSVTRRSQVHYDELGRYPRNVRRMERRK